METDPLSIQIRNRKLQDGCEGDPEEVRDVGEDDPGNEGINGAECPLEREEDEEDVCRGEEIIFKFELKIGEGEIENEIEGEWDGDRDRHCAGRGGVEHGSERYRDDDIQHRPHRPKHPRRRRPPRLDERLVRGVRVHCLNIHPFWVSKFMT